MWAGYEDALDRARGRREAPLLDALPWGREQRWRAAGRRGRKTLVMVCATREEAQVHAAYLRGIGCRAVRVWEVGT